MSFRCSIYEIGQSVNFIGILLGNLPFFMMTKAVGNTAKLLVFSTLYCSTRNISKHTIENVVESDFRPLFSPNFQ